MKKLQDPGLSVPRIYSRFVTFKPSTSTRILHLRSNLFFICSPTIPHPPSVLPVIGFFFPYFICYDHIRRVLYTLLCVCPSILDLMECYRLLVPRFYGAANDRGSHLQLKLRASVGTELLEYSSTYAVLRRLP